MGHSNIFSKVFAAFILAALVISGPGSAQPANARRAAPQSPQPAEPGPTADTSPIYTAISAGFDHSCAVTVTGGAKCWGDNFYGKLGIGIDVDVAWYPFNVVGMTSGVSAIQAGYMHTCVLINGGVKCWGQNYFGQLGNGTFTDSTTPGFVIGLTSGVSAISSKGNHACALVNGGAWCWGENAQGQLGNGSTTKSNKPVAVTDLSSGVKAISAGFNHTCALLDSGEVKCWGYNLNGQLGNGTSGYLANSSVPVTVASLTNVTAISAGEMHTCAVTLSGQAACWGYNFFGQLGNGTTTDSNVPMVISGLTTGFTAISAGGGHTCAITASGGEMCWGNNIAGQVGNGTNDFSWPTPQDVSGLSSGVTSITTGSRHSCAVMSNNIGKCWGDGNSGQLGLGWQYQGNMNVPWNLFTMSLPGAFTKLTPANGTYTWGYFLEWSESANVNDYEFCYATTKAGCTNWQIGGPQGGSTGTLLDGQTYYWQVRAKNTAGTTYANGSSTAFWSFKTDYTYPFATLIALADPNPTYSGSVRFKVIFNEPVTGVDISDFSLVLSGITQAAITSVSGTGSTYFVTVGTGKGTGTIQLNLRPKATIKDRAGNISYYGYVGLKYTINSPRVLTMASAATADGWILESAETSNLGGTVNSISTLIVGDDALNRQFRSIISFGTGILPDNAVIVSAKLKITKSGLIGTDPFSTHGTLITDIARGFFGTAAGLQIIDFQAPATKLLAGTFAPVLTTPGMYQMILAPTNFAYINKLGITQFRLRFALDDNNDKSPDNLRFYSGETAIAVYRPTLIIQYYLP